jgi:hypothetical protein
MENIVALITSINSMKKNKFLEVKEIKEDDGKLNYVLMKSGRIKLLTTTDLVELESKLSSILKRREKIFAKQTESK